MKSKESRALERESLIKIADKHKLNGAAIALKANVNSQTVKAFLNPSVTHNFQEKKTNAIGKAINDLAREAATSKESMSVVSETEVLIDASIARMRQLGLLHLRGLCYIIDEYCEAVVPAS
jgi:hypothetical protein